MELRSEDYEVSYEETLGKDRLPVTLETSLFRVAQEALTNVRKHSEATQVRITLKLLEQIVRLEVRDWGRGFQPTEVTKNRGGPGERVGLSSMRERVTLLGGYFEVSSKPGDGTSVVVEVPLLGGEEDIEHGE
jgi:signal transduction histidine kinase